MRYNLSFANAFINCHVSLALDDPHLLIDLWLRLTSKYIFMRFLVRDHLLRIPPAVSYLHPCKTGKAGNKLCFLAVLVPANVFFGILPVQEVEGQSKGTLFHQIPLHKLLKFLPIDCRSWAQFLFHNGDPSFNEFAHLLIS